MKLQSTRVYVSATFLTVLLAGAWQIGKWVFSALVWLLTLP